LQPRRQAGFAAPTLLADDKIIMKSKRTSSVTTKFAAKVLKRNIELESEKLELQRRLDRAYNDINAIRPTVAAYVAGRNIIAAVGPEMDSWLKRVVS
jgi:hypothetical protein